MDNPTNQGSGDQKPGSPESVPAPTPPVVAPAGEAAKTGGAADATDATNAAGAIDTTKNYDELAARFGTQGQELGEYREFFKNIAPLLDKLDQAPELVQAIIDGKVNKDIAQAVVEGRVDVKDAEVVTQATETVKKELGDKKYELATPEAITKLIETEVSKVRKEFSDKADLQTFEDYTQKFIENTSDFQDYAEEIDKWLDTHDVSDIEVAYYAVRGKKSETTAKEDARVAAGEAAKDVVANATGGGQAAQYTEDGTPLIDKLISGRTNPNSFFQ